MQLYEKYRPKKLGGVLGQSKAVKKIERLLERGWGGRAYWISGASGTGKTTLARIIAAHGADDWFIDEYRRNRPDYELVRRGQRWQVLHYQRSARLAKAVNP